MVATSVRLRTLMCVYVNWCAHTEISVRSILHYGFIAKCNRVNAAAQLLIDHF